MRVLAFASAISWSLAAATVATGQEHVDELTPRAIADSTYAVRILVDALAENIRRGRLDHRQFKDPQVSAALGNLANAGSRRTRQPPRADLGALWDFSIDLADFQPDGPDVLRARADVLLASTPDVARAPVTLAFRRRGDRWDLAAYGDLADRLIAIVSALEASSRP